MSRSRGSGFVPERLPPQKPFRPCVGVVTSCFNKERYIEQCVRSVREQTHRVVQHVVVDDASTDGSLEILNRLKWNYPSPTSLKVLSVTNRGQPNARNAGLIALDPLCQWVVFLDGDDWLEPNFFEECLKYIEGADAVFPKLCFRQDDPDPEYLIHWYGPGRREGEPCFHALPNQTLKQLWRGATMHPTTMFRREVLVEMGGFHGLVSGPCDWDLYIDFTARGYKMAYCPTTFYNYRIMRESQSHVRENSDGFRDEIWRHHRRSLEAEGLRRQEPSDIPRATETLE